MTWDSILDNLRGRRLWMWLGGIVFVRLIMMLVVVNGADLGILLSVWGPAPAGTAADLNGDGQVNGADLGLLLGAWGPCA